MAGPAALTLASLPGTFISDSVHGETRGICTLKGKPEPVEVIHLEPRAVVVTIPKCDCDAVTQVGVGAGLPLTLGSSH